MILVKAEGRVFITMVCIASKQLRIEIDELGAQMRSLYSIPQQMEYLWQRDAAIWSSSAPVVFPVIGKLHQFVLSAGWKNLFHAF